MNLIKALHIVLASKKIYYHGTSIKFLRSILKQGILPTTEEGVWRNAYKEEDTHVLSPSKKSLEGSYWTTSVINASSYANAAKRKLGGNPLFVAANIETRTAFPDEDDFLSIISRGMSRLWGEDANTSGSERAWVEVYYSILFNKKDGKNAIKYWRDTFVQWLKDIYPDNKYITVEYTKILDRLLITELRRRISYIDDFQYKSLVARTIDYFIYPNKVDWETIEKKYPKPKSIDEETNRRKYVDLLSQKLKKLVDRDKFNPTLRITKPVAYNGSNRIIMLLEDIEGDNYNHTFKVHYGKIPPEFLKSWKELIGGNFEVK